MDTSHEDLLSENELLRSRLSEATDTLEAIRTGQVDALVVTGENGHSLYTLKSADHAYRVFVEQMAEGAVSLNSDGLVVFSNSQFARIINRPLSQVAGHRFVEFVTDDDATRFRSLFRTAWVEKVESDLCLKCNDHNVHVKVSLTALQLDGESVLSLIVTDLTQQKKIELQLKNNNEELSRLNEALISSNHDLQQFASVASHDLQEDPDIFQIFKRSQLCGSPR